MASKRRLRAKQCDGKVRYRTEAEAFAAKRRLVPNHRFEALHALAVYLCHCGGYHLGHKRAFTGVPRRKRRQLATESC